MQPKALPSYRCHKRVQAVKIKDVSLHDPTGSDPPVPFAGGFIIHDLPDLGPIPFDAAFWEKHKPKAGDYLVIYEDGYRSISPEKAFEDGYTLEYQVPSDLQPHQQRVFLERVELEQRVRKLGEFIKENPSFKLLSQTEKWNLQRQETVMSEYLGILNIRIKAFTAHADNPGMSAVDGD